MGASVEAVQEGLALCSTTRESWRRHITLVICMALQLNRTLAALQSLLPIRPIAVSISDCIVRTYRWRAKGAYVDISSIFSLCMCVHNGFCFQCTALRNHKSAPQQTTSYATGQTVCTFISGHLCDALIGASVDVLHWCVCICMGQWCCS